MNKQALLFIGLTSFIHFSCRKDNLGKSSTYGTNPTSYVLKRQTWTGPTTNGSSFLYKYNSDHLVSAIEYYQWGSYAVNGGPSQKWYDTAYYGFEYTNGLCTKWTMNEGGGKGYIRYEYNDRDLPAKSTIYYMYSHIITATTW